MILFCKVREIEALSEFSYTRRDGTPGSSKKKTLILSGEFNEFYGEAFEAQAEEIEKLNLQVGQNVLVDVNIQCSKITAKDGSGSFVKNNIRINKLVTL